MAETTRLEQTIASVQAAGRAPSLTNLPFDAGKIVIDKTRIGDLVEIAIAAAEEVEYSDGMATLSTSTMEMLERAIHAIYRDYRPTYPDRAASACPHKCEWCRLNDAGNC